jgi:hypothetical protein
VGLEDCQSANAAKYWLLRKYEPLFNTGGVMKKDRFPINGDDGESPSDRVAFSGEINLLAD